jgi:squalene synthase HpnC
VKTTADAPAAGAPAGVPAAADVLARSGAENFPVASWVLGRRARSDLLALYGFARLVDELGDAIECDRLQALDWAEAELGRAFHGEARHPVFVALQPVLRDHSLPREPFVRLIEANRVDQRVSRYQTWEQLQGYCRLSADPVGELVLGIFGAADPRRVRLSDSICTGLQLVEHLQDVAEDRDQGRIYLPMEDLHRFGAGEQDVFAASAGPALREAIAFEVGRARGLLWGGRPLVAALPRRAGFAVAGFIAGGLAALSAIEQAGHDVLQGAPRGGRGVFLGALARTLAGRPGRGHCGPSPG